MSVKTGMLALSFALISAISLPLSGFAETKKASKDDDSTDKQLMSCLQSALASNDMAAVRDCDRFNRGSLSYGDKSSVKSIRPVN